MVTEWWEILDKLKKKEKKNTISLFVPPMEAPGAPLGGHAPQFKNHCSRLLSHHLMSPLY